MIQGDEIQPTRPEFLEAVANALIKRGRPMRASELAVEVGMSRASVMRLLHSHSGVFQRDTESRWNLKQHSPEFNSGGDSDVAAGTPDELPPVVAVEDGGVTTMPAVLRRPGPFGPAASLLPPGQMVRYAEHDEPLALAVDMMLEGDFSQLPVRRDGRVIGVLCWRDLPRQLLPLQSSRAPIARVLADPVSNYMEPATSKHFVSPSQFIDTTVDWATEQFVIVGSESHVHGILTIADVWSALNRFAEAFVILNELEDALRVLISHVAGPDLQNWLASLTTQDERRTPARLEDLHFSEYNQIITNRERWSRFEPYLPGARDLLFHQFERANRIRNDALHFRDAATPSRCDQLRRLLHRIRRALDGSVRAASEGAP